MRYTQARYLKPVPALTKKQPSVSAHIEAPIKGLSLQNKRTPGDPQTATILKNFVIEDDRIEVRAGYRKIVDTASNAPIWHLIPHHGTGRMLAATNNSLIEVFSETPGPPVVPPIVVQAGFTSNDWHWTSFSNLGEADYTVMCNGKEGVWSWDGFTATDPGDAIVVTKISDSATGPPIGPCYVTVGPGDINKFKNGMTVVISGADASHSAANGPHIISNVNNPVNTFTLVGVDTSASTGDQTTGTMRANPPGSMQKETIEVPDDAKWINPNQFNIVLAHMNRLWFADSTHQAVYYLPIQQKSTFEKTGVGRLRYIPLNVLFRRGGTIRALATWSIDGGAGMDDKLVIFSTNGECVIYTGTDPESDFTLVGIFKFDAPLSKHCVINYGGDCWAFVSTGMIPLSTMLRAESEKLGTADRSVISAFQKDVISYRSEVGWQAFLNPSTQRLFCNIPLGGRKYKQMVRHMPRPVWSEFADIPARCWAWIDPYVYFGDDAGNIYEMHPTHKSDAGKAINVDVQFAWSQFKTPNLKQWKFVKVHIITDGIPLSFVDMRTDYESTPVVNRPAPTAINPGSAWDTSDWATSPDPNTPPNTYWAAGAQTVSNWTGVSSRMATTGAVRITCFVNGCTYGLAGLDVLFEVGAPM